jgi:ubiquinone/menaquinone biosynthesis C-methylase UbiE/DNA-binding transcriptional ArsR family regulator
MQNLPDLFKALADPTRLRLLRLLDEAELHVNELVEVLELPQPTVSRHLGVLLRAGLVLRRRDGQWTFYSWAAPGPAEDAALGALLRGRLRAAPENARDLHRLEACLEARVRSSRDFYARVAPQWDRLRAGLDLEGLHGRLLSGLLPATLDLVDAGTGTGALLPVLAPAARRLLGIDRSAEMLAEAGRRVAAENLPSVSLVRADLEALPLADAAVDGVCSLFALHHVARPESVIAEFARVVRARGSVVLCDLVPHGEEWMRTELAHAWLGFPPERVVQWFTNAGVHPVDVQTVRRRQRTGTNAMPDVFVVRGRKTSGA